MAAKFRWFSQSNQNYVKKYIITTNLQSTVTATDLSTNLKTLLDANVPGLFDDWVVNKTKYVIQSFIQSRAGTTNFQAMITGTGTTENATNASLFYAGTTTDAKVDWAQGTPSTFQGYWMCNSDGTMRFFVKFNDAWNGNFYIKSFVIFQLY